MWVWVWVRVGKVSARADKLTARTSNPARGLVSTLTRRILTDDCEHDAKALNTITDEYWKKQNPGKDLPWHENLFSCHIKDYPLAYWRRDIPNREVSYLMTQMCPADHGQSTRRVRTPAEPTLAGPKP